MKLLDFATPDWFSRPEMLMYLLFAVVTALIFYKAYKAYVLTKNNKIAYFGIAFLGLSLGYFLQALLHFLVLQRVSTTDLLGTAIIHGGPSTSLSLSYIATMIHMATLVAALVILTFVTLRKERGLKIFLLLLSLSFLTMILSSSKGLAFFLLTGVLLLFITAQHIQRYLKKPTRSTYFISSGFALLFLGQILLALTYTFASFCFVGHMVTLGGYILLLMSLLQINKR